MKTAQARRMLLALVVADASANRHEVTRVLERRADITVVGQATSIDATIDLISQAKPHLILVDLHLDGGASQSVIEGIMAHCPLPILVLSRPGDDPTAGLVQRALLAGAVEPFELPTQWTEPREVAFRGAARQISKVSVIRRPRRGPEVARRPGSVVDRHTPVVAVAASTGGPSALAIMLASLAGLRAPVLVVQHMHAEFSGGLLEWMSRVSALPVSAARQGEVARDGHVYFAPAGHHLRLGAGGRLELADTPKTLHCPSADQLFQSVADRSGSAGIGVVLTGMGEDGAQGLLAIHRQGGHTLAQDESSCAVFGMPQAARRIGAVTTLLPLTDLASAVQRAVVEVLA